MAGLLTARRALAGVLVVVFVLLLAAPGGAVEVQRVVSPAGIETWLVEDKLVPVISLSASFRGGASLDPAGLEGLANMASGLLDEGAGLLASQDFQSLLEDNAISLGFEANLDQFDLTLRTLKENRGLAFRLLELALTEPRFDAEPVERIRAQIRADMARARERPRRVANRAWFKTVFPDHPYGRSLGGTPKTLAAITADDLRRFAETRLARDVLVIGVAGDISAEELEPLLDMAFAGLPKWVPPGALAEAEPVISGRTQVVKIKVPQSVVVFGQKGLKRTDPDYYALSVLNYILGGGFSSRLYEEVREKRGLAYGVYSYLAPMEYAGLLMGGVATENARVAETLEVITREWRRMRDEGPSAAELVDAKTYLAGSWPLRFTRTGRIAEMLVGMQLYDLGLDFLERRNSLIEAVEQDDLRRLARELLDPEGLTVVVVGEPEGVTNSP